MRLWTARIGGTLRVFLDNSTEPLYDGPAEPFFQRTYEALGSTRESAFFDDTYSQAEAGYYPIPFAKSLRMEWVGDMEKLHFYQVQVRLYEPGVQVTTFRREDLTRYENDLVDGNDFNADGDELDPNEPDNDNFADELHDIFETENYSGIGLYAGPSQYPAPNNDPTPASDTGEARVFDKREELIPGNVADTVFVIN